MTVASAIAARTKRIKIGTGVQVLPLCHPLRLAEETATVDQISHGRLLFGRRAQRQPAQLYGLWRALFGKPRALSRNPRHRQAGVDAGAVLLRRQVLAFRQCQRGAAAVPAAASRRSASPPPARRRFRRWARLGYPIFVAVRSGSLVRAGARPRRLSPGLQGGRSSRRGRGLSAADPAYRRHRPRGVRPGRREHHVRLSRP